MANIIAEVRANTQGSIHWEVEKVYTATLKKDTIRGVDYRKATILLSNTFEKVSPNSDHHLLFNTAVQISEVLYSRETSRSQKKILRFHNLSFQHAVQCIDTFHTPTSITKQKMFGRYFHSLSVHAPILYRQVALRSLNAELQERLFNTCNDITKTTSNRQANTILNNIIIRVQSESKLASNTLQKQEGEISALAASLSPFTNSKFSKQWIRKHLLQWQAHLECISDFLICGPGVWWKDHGNHIEFLDGPEEDDAKQEGPPLHHFRAYNLKMEEDYLKECWERCIDQNITMPIENVRVYNSKGDLVSMRMAHPSENIQQPEHSLPHQLPHTKNPSFSEIDNCYTPLTQDQPALATGTPVHCVKDHDSLGHQPTQVHNHLESELSLTEDAHDLQAEDNHNQESENESEVADVRELTDDFVPESLTSQYNPLTHLGKQVMLLISGRQLRSLTD